MNSNKNATQDDGIIVLAAFIIVALIYMFLGH